MGEDSSNNSANKSEKALCQLKMYIEVYKHHFDLFFKGVVLYLAAVGAIAGLIYRSGVTKESQIVLSVIAFIGSFIALFGCYVSRKWVIALEETVNNLANQAGAERFPFSGAKGILVVIIATSILFACRSYKFAISNNLLNPKVKGEENAASCSSFKTLID